VLLPALPQFLKDNPMLELQLGLNDRIVNLLEEGIDVVKDEGVRPCLLPPSRRSVPLMVRPLRIEFPGAVYHVTSRGTGMSRLIARTEQAKGKA
jgi:DNA-binding transcriptional LysR family regulator